MKTASVDTIITGVMTESKAAVHLNFRFRGDHGDFTSGDFEEELDRLESQFDGVTNDGPCLGGGEADITYECDSDETAQRFLAALKVLGKKYRQVRATFSITSLDQSYAEDAWNVITDYWSEIAQNKLTDKDTEASIWKHQLNRTRFSASVEDEFKKARAAIVAITGRWPSSGFSLDDAYTYLALYDKGLVSKELPFDRRGRFDKQAFMAFCLARDIEVDWLT